MASSVLAAAQGVAREPNSRLSSGSDIKRGGGGTSKGGRFTGQRGEQRRKREGFDRRDTLETGSANGSRREREGDRGVGREGGRGESE